MNRSDFFLRVTNRGELLFTENFAENEVFSSFDREEWIVYILFFKNYFSSFWLTLLKILFYLLVRKQTFLLFYDYSCQETVDRQQKLREIVWFHIFFRPSSSSLLCTRKYYFAAFAEMIYYSASFLSASSRVIRYKKYKLISFIFCQCVILLVENFFGIPFKSKEKKYTNFS